MKDLIIFFLVEHRIVTVFGITILLMIIPFASNLFGTFHTLIHETAHALSSVILRGSVKGIELNFNNSGTAKTSNSGTFSMILVALAGYFFTSAIAYLSLRFHTNSMLIKAFPWICGVFSLIHLMFWIRNWYGIIWLLLFMFLQIFVHYYSSELLLKVNFLFWIFSLNILAFKSALIVFYISIKEPGKSGDAWNLKQLTGIPSFIWGFIFFIQASVFIYYAVNSLYSLPNPLELAGFAN